MCDRFETRGVELLSPASPSKEFLLGDVPALTLDEATGAVGPDGGVPIDQADVIVMPVSPRLLVVLGRSAHGSRVLSDDEVDRYNELQVRGAQDFVYYRPGAVFELQIAAWRP